MKAPKKQQTDWEDRERSAYERRRNKLLARIRDLIQLRKHLELASTIAANYRLQREYFFQELKDLKKGTVHFRIYLKMDNRQIELLKSK